jgi:hypothetical protein
MSDVLWRMMFTDEAAVHTNGHVKRHDIWTPCEHVRGSQKVNLWCTIVLEGPFLQTLSLQMVYLGKLQFFVCQ